MVNRVLCGQKGNEFGLWISKPGVDVLAATTENMLLSVAGKNVQCLYIGTIIFGTATVRDITIANLGFKPYLTMNMYSTQNVGAVTVSYPSATIVRVTRSVSTNNTEPLGYLIMNLAAG